VAGGVLSYQRGNINVPSQFAMDWTIGAIVAVTIGGLGTLTGPVLGSMIFVLLREILGRTVPTAYLIVTGVVFVLVIVFLPNGLTGSGVSFRRLFASRTSQARTSVSKKIGNP
jgi:branched-chain amino acid transport system permease protein